MPVDTSSLFAQVIKDHLELKERNSQLENMPIERYKAADPFENHPLFKTEEQARLEETMDEGLTLPEEPVLAWPGEEPPAGDPEDSFWAKSRDFNWGD